MINLKANQYMKVCGVKRWNSQTFSNETVYFVGIYRAVDCRYGINLSRYDDVIMTTPTFRTPEEAKQASSNNLFGI